MTNKNELDLENALTRSNSIVTGLLNARLKREDGFKLPMIDLSGSSKLARFSAKTNIEEFTLLMLAQA